MGAYKHGIYVSENPTSLPIPVRNEAGVPVIVGTAPVNMVANPKINEPVLCNSFAEAKAAFGYCDDYANYSICEAMDIFFMKFAVAPVVFINVLNPSTASHKDTLTETVTITNKVGKTTATGILLTGLTVKDDESATLTPDTDYITEFNEDGTMTITIVGDSTTATVALTGNKLKPSGVVASDIIGSYEASTGASTGIEAITKVHPLLGVVPSLLCAGKWGKTSSVGAALALKCHELNGFYSCECVVGLPAEAGTVYTDVPTLKAEAGYVNPHMIVVFPNVAVGSKIYDYSLYFTALCCRSDADNDSVPNRSVSNNVLTGVTAVVLDDGTEMPLDITMANTMNAVGVVTAIKVGNEIRAWGNNSAAYPGTTDPKDRWFCCRRFFSWWGNSFIETYFDRVDEPMNRRLVESVIDSENVRGNALVSEGKAAGIRIEYRAEDNPASSILDGRVKFRQYLAPYVPAECIENVLEFDVSMLIAALGGE